MPGESLLQLDHLTVCATSLAAGAALVEECLGVQLAAGGEHAAMGTHNRLLGLGPGLYLEVIAINPAAAAPGRPRWFGLDDFTGPPRLSNWVARCDDLAGALARAPTGAGAPLALARGDLRWQMAVPDNGRLPFDGAFPALITWEGELHPTHRLADSGGRLRRLEISHPDASALEAMLGNLIDDARLVIRRGPHPSLRAVIETPTGLRTLA